MLLQIKKIDCFSCDHCKLFDHVLVLHGGDDLLLKFAEFRLVVTDYQLPHRIAGSRALHVGTLEEPGKGKGKVNGTQT